MLLCLSDTALIEQYGTFLSDSGILFIVLVKRHTLRVEAVTLNKGIPLLVVQF